MVVRCTFWRCAQQQEGRAGMALQSGPQPPAPAQPTAAFTAAPASAAHQCTKARLAYIRSNLWSRREKTSAMAVELEIMHTARCTLARSPPGTTVGGW